MSSSPQKCPVDHTTPSPWSASPHPAPSASPAAAPSSPAAPVLPTSRETSSIPRTASENWVYPSEAQFFAAMARKQHAPRPTDMRVVVPIHNAVNERAWAAVAAWEARRAPASPSTLVTFRGRPRDRSPRAWARVLLGYSAPFDRHDWVVERAGVRMRYVLDFYAGRPDPAAPHVPSFYIDARPALDSWEGVRMRVERCCARWRDRLCGADGRAPRLEGKDGS